MIAFSDDFRAESVFFRMICKGVEVEIKPVKRLSFDILVLHLIVKLSVIIVCKVYHQTSILFFKKIPQIA